MQRLFGGVLPQSPYPPRSKTWPLLADEIASGSGRGKSDEKVSVVRAGSVTLKIYTLRHGDRVRYTVAWYVGPKRHRKHFSCPRRARAFAKKRAEALAAGQVHGPQLTTAQAQDFGLVPAVGQGGQVLAAGDRAHCGDGEDIAVVVSLGGPLSASRSGGDTRTACSRTRGGTAG